jgi:4-hydroxy-tetrahydrodipicolinate synthase
MNHPPQIWGMMATPFTEDQSVDMASMRNYAATLVERGCTGLIALGVIAEPGSLVLSEKLDSIEGALAGAVPVIAAVMDADPQVRRRDAAAFVARFPTEIFALMLPVLSPDPIEVIRDIEALQEASGLSVSLQDYPASTGVSIDIRALLEVIGSTGVTLVKSEAQPTFHRIQLLRDAAPHLTLMSGLGGSSLFEDLASGATAIATGITRPEVVAEAARLWSAGETDSARGLLNSISATITFELQKGTSIGIRKEHWRRQGIINSSAVRPPTIPYQPAFAPLSRGLGF